MRLSEESKKKLRESDPTAQQFKKACNGCHGLYSILRAELQKQGICESWTFKTLKGLLKRIPEYQELFDEQRQIVNDTVELKLYEAVQKGNVVACMFWTKTQMGWREADKQNIEVNVNSTPTIINDISPSKPSPAECKTIDVDFKAS